MRKSIAHCFALIGVAVLFGCAHPQLDPANVQVVPPPPPAPVNPLAPVNSAGPVVQTETVTPPVADGQEVPIAEPAPEEFQTPIETISYSTSQVLKMYESQVSNDVILAQINSSKTPFELSADNIIYLTDLGVPAEIITAMISQDEHLGVAVAPAAPPTNQQHNTVQTANGQPGQPAAQNATTAKPVVIQRAPAVTTEVFYDSLSPYGSWIHTESYGWTWQPTVASVNVHWRPYYDHGHWLYTDAGWYWQSDYSWGWAPFHYGRWDLHRSYGWIWVPGEVWGPSWVSFRYTDSHCGWAPLPPRSRFVSGIGFTWQGSRISAGFGFGLSHRHYAFVDRKQFHRPHNQRQQVASNQVQQVFNNSTVVNNYIVGDNNTIVNQGISRDVISNGNPTSIRKVVLRDIGDSKQIARPSSRNRTEDAVPVYRPQITKTKAAPASTILTRQASRPSYNRFIARNSELQRTGIPQTSRGNDSSSSRTLTPSPSRSRPSLTSTSPRRTSPTPAVRRPGTPSSSRSTPTRANSSSSRRSSSLSVSRPSPSRSSALNRPSTSTQRSLNSSNSQRTSSPSVSRTSPSRSSALNRPSTSTQRSYNPSNSRRPSSLSVSRPSPSRSSALNRPSTSNQRSYNPSNSRRPSSPSVSRPSPSRSSALNRPSSSSQRSLNSSNSRRSSSPTISRPTPSRSSTLNRPSASNQRSYNPSNSRRPSSPSVSRPTPPRSSTLNRPSTSNQRSYNPSNSRRPSSPSVSRPTPSRSSTLNRPSTSTQRSLNSSNSRRSSSPSISRPTPSRSSTPSVSRPTPPSKNSSNSKPSSNSNTSNN